MECRTFVSKVQLRIGKRGESILQLRGFIQKPKINQKFQKNLNIFFLPIFGRSQQLKYKEAETLAYNQSKRLGSLKFVGMSDISFRPEYNFFLELYFLLGGRHFCSTSLPRASSRWIRLKLSSLCPLF